MKVGEFFNLDQNPSWCMTGVMGKVEIFPSCPTCGCEAAGSYDPFHDCIKSLKSKLAAAEQRLEEQKVKNREINELKDFLGYGDIFEVLSKIKKRFDETQETSRELLKSYKEKCQEYDNYVKISTEGADAALQKIRQLEEKLKQKSPEQIIDSAVNKLKGLLNELVK